MKVLKKVLLLLIVITMIAGLSACNSANNASNAGQTAEGTAKGMGGDVTVTLTVKDGKITNVVAKGDGETPGIGLPLIESLPKVMVENNTINVDIVSGATITSEAIMKAAKKAIKNLGLNVDDFSKEIPKPVEEVKGEIYDVDVVVVGAGGAGLTAAITVYDNGKKVIVLESQSMVGGNTIRSTGGLNATKTEFQDKNEFGEEAGVLKTLDSAKKNYIDNKEIMDLVAIVEKQYEEYKSNGGSGYFDSTELMELDTMVGGTGENDFDLVKVLCENSDDAIEWLKSIGATLDNVGAFGGASVKRIHRPVNVEGKTVSVGSYLVPLFEKAVNERGINIVYNTRADKIMTEGNKVVGVHAVKNDGSEVIVNAKNVILATGGFGANLEMVTKYDNKLDGFMTTNAPGAQGDGIIMAQAIGADVADIDKIQIHPTVEANTSALITEGLRGDGAILVNQEGKRFIDEVGTRDVVSAAEIAQTGSYSYLIVDKKMLDASSVIQGYVNKGYTKEGNTYEELAKALSIPEEAFANTMNAWNECVVNKNDPEFGRTSFAAPLDEAPFYAVKVTAGIHHTMGGLKIDTDTHVLDTNGNIIEGLYAAGEVTGDVHGSNRLGGNAVCDVVVFGRIAGENASK